MKHIFTACAAVLVGFATWADVTVDAVLPAGNIVFEKIEGDEVFVHQDLRDTQGDWFYWAMRVKGAAGRTLTFTFTKSPAVGVRGPVVSRDGGKSYAYAAEKGATRQRFTYTFAVDEDETWFYECHPYVRADWDRFTAKHGLATCMGNPAFEVGTLCKSRKGADVPLARVGCLQKAPKYRIMLSARHHCSETMASWVLEGVIDAFLAPDELGVWLRENVELTVVPFVDYDGSQAGDQGKNRKPHDHNRDYTEFLYPETKALAALLGADGKRYDLYLDVHCPWLFGAGNECLYTPWKDPKTIHDIPEEKRFSRLLEKLQCGSMRYRASDDFPFGVGWNTDKNYAQGLSSVRWALANVPSLRVCRTYEVPFANANGAVVTPETCRELGRDTAKVFKIFFAADVFRMDASVMDDAYWKIWNAAEQAKIDADIEKYRKADGEFAIDAPAGTLVKVEQIGHEFKFGAHIFNFDQLGKTEYNDAYKASYGRGGIFNSATVAFYWDCYEPISGRMRPYGDYEDTERFWNSLTREEAMDHRFWRRPAPGPVVNFCKEKDIRIHGHILIWGSAKPFWIYDLWCPENEKRVCDRLGIPRNGAETVETDNWEGGYKFAWKAAWEKAYRRTTEKELAAKMPEFTANMRKLFHDRVFGVAGHFGDFVDSWDVVNESSRDWARYRKSRTDLPLWFSVYGLMPGDYPLWALLDAKEAFPARAKLNINDYNICEDFLSQVNELQREGAKIDIVGCQMHIFETNDCARLAKGATDVNWVGTPAIIQGRLDMMAKTGKPIHVSEITITSPGADDKSRMIQAILTYNIYRKWFSHPAMMGITWWNTVDGGGVKGEPLVSGLFTSDMQKKPAYKALDRLINHEWTTMTSVPVEDGRIRFRGFRGRYRFTWEDDVGTLHYREADLTGEGVKEKPEDAWSLVRRPSASEIPQDHLRVIPAVRMYGPVALDVVRAKTVAEIVPVAKSAPLAVKLGEKPADVRELVKDSGFVCGQEGRDAVYMSFKVKSPRKFKTFIYEKCDWYGTLFVNGRLAEETAGDTSRWTGIPVVLGEGENEVVFRFTSGTAGWGATLAIRDPENELVFVRE